ncbi:unnamed protein product [Bemisia tabaci]|uniref:Uncharacterized protein n=1 Tax=Bemisia tabaci TaxID=7038 RepID=A0A9P0EZX0_BEMTA|nr:unnamed protein product [Bemisia tabaci]
MPDHVPSCQIVMRWRERCSRVVIENPAHLCQRIPENRAPLYYPEEPVVLRPAIDTPQEEAERAERYARWPIYDPPWEVTNWEGDIRPLEGYDAWLQEQEEARARWEEEFPPYEGLEDEMYSSEDEEEVYESNEEQVEEPLVLPYPDEEEDRDFFLDEMIF